MPATKLAHPIDQDNPGVGARGRAAGGGL